MGTNTQLDSSWFQGIDIMHNPIVVSLAFFSKYVIAALGGIAIILGIINVMKLVLHYMRGDKQKMQQHAAGGIFGMGGEGMGRNPLVVTLVEFFLGVILIGLFASGAWVNFINSLMGFGGSTLNGLQIPPQH